MPVLPQWRNINPSLLFFGECIYHLLLPEDIAEQHQYDEVHCSTALTSEEPTDSIKTVDQMFQQKTCFPDQEAPQAAQDKANMEAPTNRNWQWTC